MIKNIKYKNKTFGFIITYKKKKGVNFLTPNNLSHQIGFIKHSRNHIIQPHWHHKNSRIINYTSEVLIILKGKIRVDFYTKKETLKDSIQWPTILKDDYQVKSAYAYLKSIGKYALILENKNGTQ
jgi:hypothetical protein